MTKRIRPIAAKKIWPVERKLINRIVTNQKGYHTKPYPSKNKIPTEALHSVKGALHVLDMAEKKKPNKGHIVKYRKEYEHQKALPESHHFAFKKKEKKASPPKKKLTAAEKEARKEAKLAKDPTYKASELTLQRKSETKEERMVRLAASLAKARAQFVSPSSMSGPTNLKDVIKTHLGASIPKNIFDSGMPH